MVRGVFSSVCNGSNGMVAGSLLAFVLLIVSGAAQAGFPSGGPQQEQGPVLLPEQGPDAPAVTDPVASVTVFDGVLWAWSGATRTNTVALPDVEWDRVFMRFHSWPNHPGGDPWDRLFVVAVEGTEVLHGTTPRGDFEIREDITEYSVLLGGDEASVALHLASWAGAGLFATVELLFYQEPTALVGDRPVDEVVAGFTMRGVGGTGTHTSIVQFGEDPPERATIELFTSGHTQDGEFWYLNAPAEPEPPRFRVFVDDVHVGTVHALPYVYALLGFDGSSTAWLINQWLWWSGHQALDAAGVYTGVGKIPAYRAELPEDLLPVLSGERTVTLVKETHGGHWPTSVNFLLDHGDSLLPLPV